MLNDFLYITDKSFKLQTVIKVKKN